MAEFHQSAPLSLEDAVKLYSTNILTLAGVHHVPNSGGGCLLSG